MELFLPERTAGGDFGKKPQSIEAWIQLRPLSYSAKFM